MTTSSKKSAQQLANSLYRKGVKHIVISPGSRNAPMIVAFTSHNAYTCHSVPDERAAAFIALGMAHQTQSPVALVCTSGSALLNYYPAVAEAFYRHIPLVLLSADRPDYLVDQGDGQTIRQENVFANHILYSAALTDNADGKDLWFNQRKINEALNTATAALSGPVHLNVPFEEPFYGTVEITFDSPQITEVLHPEHHLSASQTHWITEQIKSAKRPMILVGQQDGSPEINAALAHWSNSMLILTETTSNTQFKDGIHCIDRFLMGLSAEEQEALHPDLLITIGGFIVSKKIKQILRAHTIAQHIHVGHQPQAPDTYQSLSAIIPMSAEQFLRDLGTEPMEENTWVKQQLSIYQRLEAKHQEVVTSLPFSDFQVVRAMQAVVQSGHNFHLANSTSVRYAQLFSQWQNPRFFCNRGTSGIDGIVSTAVGHALTSSITNWLLIGDISFFYDTNALWHAQKPTNLKIVVLNNNGGGIFRFIDGPNATGQLETHFETQQANSVANIAKSFGVTYLEATSESDLHSQLNQLAELDGSGILEVHTPRILNADILKEYFKKLKN